MPVRPRPVEPALRKTRYSAYQHLNDDGRLQKQFNNKRTHAKGRDLGFLLSLDEYCKLMEEAGITSSMVKRNGYHLARYEDKGSYIVGNCRFVPFHVNRAELTPARISAAMSKYYETNPGSFTGKKHSDKSKRKMRGHTRQNGAKNSQYGKPRSEETKRKIAEGVRKTLAAKLAAID